MKAGIHPDYRTVVFDDTSAFYTGQMKIVDTAGRVERFRRRHGERRR